MCFGKLFVEISGAGRNVWDTGEVECIPDEFHAPEGLSSNPQPRSGQACCLMILGCVYSNPPEFVF